MNPRRIAPLGKETVCPACGQGTLLLYPIIRDGNVTGHERRCSFCHKGEGASSRE
jgi:ribosomal protein S27AE